MSSPHSPSPSDYPPDSGEALHLAGRMGEAAAAYQAALARNPQDARTLSNYGGLLCALGAFQDAQKILRKAITLAPDLPDAWCNLGNTFLELQQYDEAIAAYSACLRLNPAHVSALSNLGGAFDCRGEHEMALKFHGVATRLAPDNAEIRTNRAISLLSHGDYAEGLPEYEWRWGVRTTRPHGIEGPLWKGETFTGKTLLIHTEGGFGDMIQFSRFIPDARARGGRVLVRIRKELLTLLQDSFPDQEFVTEDQPVPPHDLQCPVLSLPLALGIHLGTIPLSGGFLRCEPEKVAVWKSRLAKDAENADTRDGQPLRIGLVWAGAPHSEIREAEIADRRRSTDLATLAPLAKALPGALFYSLQLGAKADQARNPPAGMTLIDHTSAIRDFSDTAAFISCLDAVVAVDTSTAHVAAGLGKPLWLLSRYDQCWRWLAKRTDSPWYDSVTICRQTRPLDWTGPVLQVVRDLRALSEARARQAVPENA